MLARASRHVIHLEIGQPDFPAGALAYTYDANHPNAVGSVSDGRSFQYDGNGNMTTRVSGGVSLSLGYDAENHLVSMQGSGISNRYVYDGDGRRVLAVDLAVGWWRPSSARLSKWNWRARPAMPSLPAPSINGDTTYTVTAQALSQACVTWKSYYAGAGGSVERVEYGDPAKTDQSKEKSCSGWQSKQLFSEAT